MATQAVRHFVYQYNQHIEETEDDLTGVRDVPIIGSVIIRNEREWKVVHVIAPVTLTGAMPRVRVFLREYARPRTPAEAHLPN